ncbi:MAG: GNAT family N-acetyltransferase [Pseudomonadota bacterium]
MKNPDSNLAFAEPAELENWETISSFESNGTLFSLRCYDSVSGLSSLENDWRKLEEKSVEGFDYFQTFDWCYRWCEIFIKSDAPENADLPQVFALYADDCIAMIWPLMKVQSRSGLVFLESLSIPLGQYSNVLHDADLVNVETGRQVWAEIKRACGADAVSICDYPESGFLAEILGTDGIDEAVKNVSSILDYSKIENWDAYLSTLSKSQRKQRRQKLSKLEALGKIELRICHHHDPDFHDLAMLAVDMKREWLSRTSRHSQSLFEEDSAVFLSGLRQKSICDLGLDGPVLFMLELENKPIAFELGMLRQKHYYSYLGSIDLDYASYSPGKVQIDMAQKWAFENGVDKFDFLSDPSEYKKSWSNLWVPVIARYFPITQRGWIYCAVWKAQLKPFIRSLYRRANPNMRKYVNRLLGVSREAG